MVSSNHQQLSVLENMGMMFYEQKGCLYCLDLGLSEACSPSYLPHILFCDRSSRFFSILL